MKPWLQRVLMFVCAILIQESMLLTDTGRMLLNALFGAYSSPYALGDVWILISTGLWILGIAFMVFVLSVLLERSGQMSWHNKFSWALTAAIFAVLATVATAYIFSVYMAPPPPSDPWHPTALL